MGCSTQKVRARWGSLLLRSRNVSPATGCYVYVPTCQCGQRDVLMKGIKRFNIWTVGHLPGRSYLWPLCEVYEWILKLQLTFIHLRFSLNRSSMGLFMRFVWSSTASFCTRGTWFSEGRWGWINEEAVFDLNEHIYDQSFGSLVFLTKKELITIQMKPTTTCWTFILGCLSFSVCVLRYRKEIQL